MCPVTRPRTHLMRLPAADPHTGPAGDIDLAVRTWAVDRNPLAAAGSNRLEVRSQGLVVDSRLAGRSSRAVAARRSLAATHRIGTLGMAGRVVDMVMLEVGMESHGQRRHNSLSKARVRTGVRVEGTGWCRRAGRRRERRICSSLWLLKGYVLPVVVSDR